MFPAMPKPTARRIRSSDKSGHAAHSAAARDQAGLSGKLERPIKITMLGAGSGFTPKLVNDVLAIPGECGGTVALVDTDRNRLRTMKRLIEMIIALRGKTDWRVIASADRREVMKGSDYLVNCIEVSGTECVRFDNDIPAKFGVAQCIGDTIGPGGLFKALRTVPVFLDVLKDAEELCPRAIVLNYTNPMSMMCLAAGRTSNIPVVGLCHSVQGTSALLARRAGVEYSEMDWECAGINHLAWFTKLKHNGRDLYPKLMKLAAEDIARARKQGWESADPAVERPEYQRDLVRKDIMLHFGAFVTESSGHLSEYVPYYRKRRDLIEAYCRPGYDGGTGFYADNWPEWRKAADRERAAMLRGEKAVDPARTWEYASWIIEAREKNVPYKFHGNVMNSKVGGDSLIANLPSDGCVEVACMVDRNGIQPLRFGALPPQMAALCDWNMRMFDLGATAAIERSKEAAIHALLLDPLTAAACSPAEIKAMALELFQAEKDYLPGYR